MTVPRSTQPHGKYSLVLIDEHDVPVDMRSQAGALLVDVFGIPAAAERGWIHCEPVFRVLALRGGALVGQRSTFRIGNDPELFVEGDLFVAGFGDMAVRADERGRGLARAMTGIAVAEAIRRDASVMLTSTIPMRSVFGSMGFRAANAGEFLFEPDGHEDMNLMVRWIRPAVAPVRLVTEF